MINVTRSSLPPYDEYCKEIKDIWGSYWMTNMGIKHKQLEADLKTYLNVPNITLYVNGHLALENIITALGLTGEVITTPFTFASTTHAIVRCDCTPVFCDINRYDYTLDTQKLESLITERTSAILPVHVYGNLCDVDEIDRIAKKYQLKVIYDAAHAFGVTFRGVSSAAFGDASMFSFHATKVFNTIEGGAVSYRDSVLSQKLDDLKNFGIRGPEEVVYVGGNAKMNEFSAAMGICNLRHLTEEIEKRRSAAERYRCRFDGAKGIELCTAKPGVSPNYAYFPVMFSGKFHRDEVFERLRSHGVICRKYFYPLTNAFDCYSERAGFDPSSTPIAKAVSERILTLPLYAGLSCNEVDDVCNTVLAD